MWIKSEYFICGKLWKPGSKGDDCGMGEFLFSGKNRLCKQKKSTFKS